MIFSNNFLNSCAHRFTIDLFDMYSLTLSLYNTLIAMTKDFRLLFNDDVRFTNATLLNPKKSENNNTDEISEIFFFHKELTQSGKSSSVLFQIFCK